MKRKSLLVILLLALGVPIAAIGQGSLPFSQDFNSGTTLPAGWTNFVQSGNGTSGIVSGRLTFVCTQLPSTNPKIAVFGVEIPTNNTGDNVMRLSFDYSGDQNVVVGYVQGSTFHAIQSFASSNGISTPDPIQVAFPADARLAFTTGANAVTTYNVTTNRPSAHFATIDNVTITSVRPTNLVASNIDDNSATITWNANNALVWEVQYRQSGASNWSVSETLLTNSVSLSNLSASTSYDVKVRAKATSENYYTAWSETSFTTTAAACPAPTNLTVSNINSNSATVNWESTGTWFVYQIKKSGEDEWATPAGISGTGNTFASLSEILEPNTTYDFRVQNVCTLDPFEGSTYATTQFTTETIPCSAPTGLTVSNITATGATFAWNAEEGEVFEYFMRPLPYTYNEEHFILDGNDGPYYGPYTYPVSFDPDTDYIFYLRKKCGENVYSDPVSVEFHTPCGFISALGYSENFDELTVPSEYNPSVRALPSCWSAINTTTYELYSVYPSIYNYNNNAYSGSNCLTLYSSISTIYDLDPQPQYAILPMMDDLSGIQVTLWAKGDSNNTGSYCSFKIGTMTEPDDVSTFSLVTEQPLTTSYEKYDFYIPSTTDKYIAFMIDAADSNRDINGVYIDDIVIPTCSKPRGLRTAELTAHSVRIEWFEEEGAMFQVLMPGGQPSYPFDPNNPPTTWNTVAQTDNFAIWNTLSPETTYGVWLRKYCSESDQSEPIYIMFTTPEACPAPTGLHVAELTAHSVRIEWDAEEGAMFQEVFNTMSFDPNTPPTDWGNYTDYDNFAEWDGLAPEHFYGIWVRKYCSETDQSEPIYITFTTPEACPAPTGLTVSNITSTGASFSWDAEAGATFEYFTIGDPWEGFEPAPDQNWTSTPYNTAGWTNAFPPNSVQRFYLRKNCGNDGYSDYTYVEFRTLCGPMSLINGYSEDFNNFTNVSTNEYDTPTGYPDVDLPHCWQFLNRSESAEGYPQAFLSSNSEYAVSGNCLFFKSSSTTPLYAILPEFVQDIAEYQLTFTYCNENVNENNGTLYVGYMTDPSNASTFVQTLACPQTITKTTMTAYFPNAPQGSLMAFQYVGGTYNNYYLGIDDVVVTTGPTCFPTGTLDLIGVSSRTATLSWSLIDYQQNAWVVEYSKSNQFFEPVYVVDATQNWNFVIENLDPLTTYYVRVRGNCGDGSLSDVSNTITFTTLDACPVPTNVTASNLTQNTADISWTGSEDVGSYHVKWHRTSQVVGINEQFDEEYLAPDGWQVKTGLLSDVMNGAALSGESSPYWHFGTSNGVFDSHAYLEVWNTSCKSWLITPRHRVKQIDSFTFDLALTAYSGTVGSPATTGTDDRFVVLISIDGGQSWDILREWNNSGSDYVYDNIAHTATGEQVSIDLSDYVGIDVSIAFYGESTVSNANNNLHIDNVKIGTQYGAGGYYNYQFSQPFATLTDNLEPGMEYEVQVKSDCSDPEVWSEPITFKTLDAYTKVFVGGQAFENFTAEQVGDQWSNPNNWVPYGMPYSDNGNPVQDVIIRHNAVISDALGNHIIANANSITFEGDPKPTLTLKEGSQLRLNTGIDQPDVITVEKSITGFTPGAKDHYYLISSPAHWAGQYNPVNGIVSTLSDYDLYAFDPAASDGLEWRNYKLDPTNFRMDWGSGYLYANADDVEISVTGPVNANNQPSSVFNYNYYENEAYSFNGWKLCGNTFTCDAYLSTESQTMAFYRMNAEGTGFVVASGAIKPMEGFFIQGTVRGEAATLSRTAPANRMKSLNIVLSQVAARRDGSTTLDNAIIRFDEGNTLEKLSFREGSSKVYMPVEGKDYAVVNAGQMGELPVNFKAESNGSYTLSFTNEEVTFSYLHLIDNLTGNDVDLLAPVIARRHNEAIQGLASYTFDARTTDDANRFMLMYATDGNTQNDFVAMDSAFANLRDQVPVLPLLPIHVLETHQDASPMTIAIGLYPGWNWIAPTVEVSVEAMQTELGSDAVICEEENTSIITPGQMAKVHVDEGGMYDLTGRVATASITIEGGTNWIGYTGVQNTAISAALATYGIMPQNGDKIISQDGGFAIYNGTSWEGTLTLLEQGKGYIYVRPSTE